MRKILLFILVALIANSCSKSIKGCNQIYLTKTVKTDCSGSKEEGTWSCESYECPSLF